MRGRLLLGLILLPAAASAGVPLPPAPVRIVIPDRGGLRCIPDRSVPPRPHRSARRGDPVVAAWRRSQVGAKLEDQWSKLAGRSSVDLDHDPGAPPEGGRLRPARRRRPRRRDGGRRRRRGPARALEARNGEGPWRNPLSGGGRSAPPRGPAKPNVAWGWPGPRPRDRLFLATSEEALTLALDELLAGRSFEAPLAGLVSVDLDAEALAKDRYFRREFLFGPTAPAGHVRAALRLEGGHLVEVREGQGDPGPAGAIVRGAWRGGGRLGNRTRRRSSMRSGAGSSSPWPRGPTGPSAHSPLPSATPASTDRYLVDLRRPPAAAIAWEEGDVALWRDLLRKNPVSGWGYALGADGSRRIVFRWPESLDADLLALCSASVARRGGLTATVDVRRREGDPRRPRPAGARAAPHREAICGWREARPSSSTRRRRHPRPTSFAGRGWTWRRCGPRRLGGPRAEGPSAPERVRPFSDRILGLLGWMPETKSLEIERRRSPKGWTERVVFGTAR